MVQQLLDSSSAWVSCRTSSSCALATAWLTSAVADTFGASKDARGDVL